MYLDGLLGIALTLLSLSALWVFAMRVVSPSSPSGLDRFLAGCTVVAAAAVFEALALGLIGLGTTPVALLAASAALALIAALTLPSPDIGMREEVAAGWSRLDAGSRAAIGAGVGLFVAYCAFALLELSPDFDTTFLHIPQVSGWIDGGSPGAIELITTGYPVGNYPLTNEVLLAWLGGLSENIGLLFLLPVLMAAVLGIAMTHTLRTLGCDAHTTVIALVAFALVPLVTDAVTSLDTDLPAITWIAVCVAFCTRVASRKSPPELLLFALTAFGLAVGTKTTVAPLGLLALGVAAFRTRPLPRAPLIALATVAAAVAGGVWYLRNLVEHRSLLWPFVDLPGGDPLPPGIGVSDRFIEDPLATLDGRVGDYIAEIGAAPLLILAAIALPLLRPGRRWKLAALAVVGSFLLWSAAPVTGFSGDESAGGLFNVTGARYLLSSIFLATLVVAAVASRGGLAGGAALISLVAAVVFGAVDFALGRDGLAPLWVPIAGAAFGAIVALALSGQWVADRGRQGFAVAAAACVVLAAAALAAYPGKFADRYADRSQVDNILNDTGNLYGELGQWFEDQPAFRDGNGPIFSAPAIGPLVGGRLQHLTRLIDPEWDCGQITAEAEGGWVVIPESVQGARSAAGDCFAGQEPVHAEVIASGAALEVYEVGSTTG